MIDQVWATMILKRDQIQSEYVWEDLSKSQFKIEFNYRFQSEISGKGCGMIEDHLRCRSHHNYKIWRGRGNHTQSKYTVRIEISTTTTYAPPGTLPNSSESRSISLKWHFISPNQHKTLRNICFLLIPKYLDRICIIINIIPVKHIPRAS